ncbi:MAG: dTDP-4-dehydrorhamnose 3,5-epimerase [Azonexus sp.]
MKATRTSTRHRLYSGCSGRTRLSSKVSSPGSRKPQASWEISCSGQPLPLAQGVLRGLHYQLAPAAQGKLVRVVQGRSSTLPSISARSPSFGRWVGEILSAENRRQLWIFLDSAHGFLTLLESAEFLYKTTDTYRRHERSISNTRNSNEWPLDGPPIVSAKDAMGTRLAEAELT